MNRRTSKVRASAVIPLPRPSIWIALALLLGLTACAAIGRPEIGMLRAEGPEVFLNGRPAVDGQNIRSGDRVSTGAGSSARVEFFQGGSVQLNESTDPTFEQLVDAVKCVFRVIMSVGEIVVDSGGSCQFETETPQLAALQNSLADFRVRGNRTILTLIEGSALISAPVAVEVRPAEQIVVAEGVLLERRFLEPSELRELIAWRNRYVFPPLYQVPQLERLNLDQARDRLRGARLEVGRVNQRPDNRFIPNTVVGQSPRPGTLVRAGTPVGLTVAVEKRVFVPNLVGLQIQQALRELERADLRLGQTRDVERRDVRPGTVLEQSIRPGAHILADTGVNLVVAIEVQVTVPRLTNRTLGDARANLQRLGLREGRVIERRTNAVREGIVLDQAPRAGQRVSLGSRVDLYVSVPDIVRVPNLFGQTPANASELLRNRGLSLRYMGELRVSGNYPKGTIIKQEPLSGTPVKPRTEVQVWTQYKYVVQ